MKMTELQYASLVISLSTLGQVEISGVDAEQLHNLDYLLEAALENVRRAVHRSAPQITSDDDRSGWLNMSNGEEVP